MSGSTSNSEMQYRTLGSTGERVSAIGLGGWHLSLKHVDEQLAIRIVRTAIDRGITFMDNSWDYNGGVSEIRMGKALRDGYRDKVFLMTKIDGRSKKEGANAALIEAREAGKLRYIGFTGHKAPQIHLHMLEVAAQQGFKFDAVQMPLNVMDAHYRSFGKLVVPELVKQNIGILGMKSMANGILLQSNTVTPIECLHYALNLPTSVVITGIDTMEILDQAFEAVRTFQPMNDEQVRSLLAKTAEAASRGEFEPFKTSSIFDGTAQNPDWLGEEPQRIQQLMSA